MTVGETFDIEFQTSDKSGPTAMSANSAFQILTGLNSSVRRLSSEEHLAKLSRLLPSSLTYVESPQRTTLEDLQPLNRVSLFAERVATCNMLHDG